MLSPDEYDEWVERASHCLHILAEQSPYAASRAIARQLEARLQDSLPREEHRQPVVTEP